MSFRAEVLEISQIGKETTYGTGVAANKRLYALKFDLDPMVPTEKIIAQGTKSAAGVIVAKEHTQINVTGQAAYNDLIYLFSSVLAQAVVTTPATNGTFTVTITGSPTGGTFTLTYNSQTTSTIAYNAAASVVQSALEALSTIEVGEVAVSGSAGGPYTVVLSGSLASSANLITASGAGLTGGSSPGVTVSTNGATNTRRWTFFPSDTDADTFDSFTIEKGSSLGASSVPGVRCDEIDLTFVPDKSIELKAKLFGKVLSDGITMTSSPSAVALKPLTPRNVDVYLAASEAALAAGQIKPLEARFSIKNRHTQVYELNSSETSCEDTVERMLDVSGQIIVEQNSAANAYMTALRAGTEKFLRIVVTGETIETGFPYKMIITMPFEFQKGSRGARQDVHCGTYDIFAIHDATFNGSVKVVIDTAMTAL